MAIHPIVPMLTSANLIVLTCALAFAVALVIIYQVGRRG